MKTKFYLFLFVAVALALLTACGTPVTSTPTLVEEPTDLSVETETMVPTMETTVTEVMSGTETETPVMNETGTATTPTATGPAGAVPVSLVCWFCIQQVPHVIVTVPQSATFNVVGASNVECNSVDTVNDLQVVLCQGPKQSGANVSFDLNVCGSDGSCSEHHLAAVDCLSTAVPSEMPMLTGTVSPTVIATGSATLAAGGGTMTVTPAAGTGTGTPVAMSSGTPTAIATATPTP